MCSAIERTQNIIQIYNKEKNILIKKKLYLLIPVSGLEGIGQV